ncbi:MAG TPA: hypothetical protein DHU80_02830 [Cryomorphaceae bacterium]|nr:hypothetical protein [Cryomorphaceae bacterium]HCY25141.1 hypothetical protein [Cryomorphaceae bacterium]
MRQIGSRGTRFFSRDQFWWNGTEISHEQVDEYSDLRDLNNRPIFELDIVEFSMGQTRDRLGVVLWSEAKESWIIKDINDRELQVPVVLEGWSLFERQDIKFHAFLFSNPDLMMELGVRDD